MASGIAFVLVLGVMLSLEFPGGGLAAAGHAAGSAYAAIAAFLAVRAALVRDRSAAGMAGLCGGAACLVVAAAWWLADLTLRLGAV